MKELSIFLPYIVFFISTFLKFGIKAMIENSSQNEKILKEIHFTLTIMQLVCIDLLGCKLVDIFFK